MNWVDQHSESLYRFVYHLGSISISNVFRKLLDATDRQPPPTSSRSMNSDDEDQPPKPTSSFEMSTLSGDSQRRILWEGCFVPTNEKEEDPKENSKEDSTENSKEKSKEEKDDDVNPASIVVVSTILKVFQEINCEDDKYVSAGDALIDCVNRSTAQETILSLQNDEPPRNTATDLMRALNTPTSARMLMSAAVSPKTAKCAVQGCLSVVSFFFKILFLLFLLFLLFIGDFGYH